MQYIPCKSALLAQEAMFLPKKAPFMPKDLKKKVPFWVKNSVSWARSALLHGIYCILYWVKLANLQLPKKRRICRKIVNTLLTNIFMAIFALAERLSIAATLQDCLIHNSHSNLGWNIDFAGLAKWHWNSIYVMMLSWGFLPIKLFSELNRKYSDFHRLEK